MIRCFAALVLLATTLALVPTARAGTVYVVTVSGGINPAVSDYIQSALAEAESQGAEALVLELDTPGGLLSSTKDIVTALLNARVPVIVFVSPRGAWAGSAGTFITLAGHVAVMAPGSTIGAAHPVSFLPGGTPPAPEEEGKEPAPRPRDIAGEKIEKVTIAFIESIARERNRNVEWAIEAVRNSEAIGSAEAVEKNVVDLVADDLDHLLDLVDGRTVQVGRDDVTLSTKGAQVERIEMGVVNAFFHVISDPQIAMLLILAGLLGLYVEFTQPGTIFPGVAGAVCLVLAALSLQIIPFNWLGLILILTGIGLLVAELFVTSFGVLFASGIACLAIGGYVLRRLRALRRSGGNGRGGAVLVGGFSRGGRGRDLRRGHRVRRRPQHGATGGGGGRGAARPGRDRRRRDPRARADTRAGRVLDRRGR
jgi:membrane-bound serine protease (ClpP class)